MEYDKYDEAAPFEEMGELGETDGAGSLWQVPAGEQGREEPAC